MTIAFCECKGRPRLECGVYAWAERRIGDVRKHSDPITRHVDFFSIFPLPRFYFSPRSLTPTRNHLFGTGSILSSLHVVFLKASMVDGSRAGDAPFLSLRMKIFRGELHLRNDFIELYPCRVTRAKFHKRDRKKFGSRSNHPANRFILFAFDRNVIVNYYSHGSWKKFGIPRVEKKTSSRKKVSRERRVVSLKESRNIYFDRGDR